MLREQSLSPLSLPSLLQLLKCNVGLPNSSLRTSKMIKANPKRIPVPNAFAAASFTANRLAKSELAVYGFDRFPIPFQ